MDLTENTLFLVVVAVIIIFASIVYTQASFDQDLPSQTQPPILPTPQTSITSTTISSASPNTTLTFNQSNQTPETLASTTILQETPPTTTLETSTSLNKTTTTTSYLKNATRIVGYHIDKYGNMGYRIVYFKMAYMSPTCVPSVNRILQQEAGVKSKSMGYRQKESWVIYDPEIVSIDRILTLARAGGEAEYLRDEEI